MSSTPSEFIVEKCDLACDLDVAYLAGKESIAAAQGD
jgi:hypothetical protein